MELYVGAERAVCFYQQVLGQCGRGYEGGGGGADYVAIGVVSHYYYKSVVNFV